MGGGEACAERKREGEGELAASGERAPFGSRLHAAGSGRFSAHGAFTEAVVSSQAQCAWQSRGLFAVAMRAVVGVVGGGRNIVVVVAGRPGLLQEPH